MRKLVLVSLMLLSGLVPVLAQEEVRTLPPEVYGLMKSGHRLGKLWISPSYDVTKGFTLGPVASEASGVYSDSVRLIPQAFGRLVIVGSPYVLHLSVVELSDVERNYSEAYFSATLGLEGKVVDPSGKVMLAFRTRDTVNDRSTVETNFQGVVDKLVWSVYQDLGKPFQHALELQATLAQGNPANALPLPPPPPEAPLDLKGRLMRLEDLRQKGLITQEEYQAHKEELMKAL